MQIAKAINVKQKTVSTYLSENPPYDAALSAETQYKLLNFLISQETETLYQSGKLIDYQNFPEFDCMGYYYCQFSEDTPVSEELKTKTLAYLLFLLNNFHITGTYVVYSKQFIQFSPSLYRLIIRQVDASYHYALLLPSTFDKAFEGSLQQQLEGFRKNYQAMGSEWIEKNKQTIIETIEIYTFQYHVNWFYYHMDVAAFSKIWDALIAFLKSIVYQQEIQLPTEEDKIYQAILMKQLAALLNAIHTPSHNPKECRLRAKEILNAMEKGGESLKMRLFENIFSIIYKLKPVDQRKKHIKKMPSFERTIKTLCSLPMEIQEVILDNADVFFDFEEDFEKDMLYIFIHRVANTYIGQLANIDIDIMSEIEKIVFNGMYFFMAELEGMDTNLLIDSDMHPHMVIPDGFEKIYKFLKKYINMCEQAEWIEENKNLIEKTVFSEKNEMKFRQHISESLCKNVNVLEVIRCKLEFEPYGWYLWGLLKMGIQSNPEKIYQTISKCLNADDVCILSEVYIHEKETDYE